MACPGQMPDVEDVEPVVLTDIDHIRRRPGMYIGSTDSRGLNYLLFELVTSSVTEIAAGRGRSVSVTLRADNSVEVADDAPPMPVNASGDEVPLEFNFMRHIGVGHWPSPDRRDPMMYLAANALSEWLRVVAHTDCSQYQHTFRHGVTASVLQSGGPPDACGLTVAFRPDPLIFGDARFDPDAIRDHLQQLAFMHSGVRLIFTDELAGTRDVFEYADGIRACVQWLNANRRPIHPDAILIRGEEQGVRYEIGLQWCDAADEIRFSFANHHRTPRGGTHESGMRAGVALALRDYLRAAASQTGELEADDLRAGLTGVVSVLLRDPMFEGATRERLGNLEAESVVRAAVRRGLREYLEANADMACAVVQMAVRERDARVAARATLNRIS